MAEHLIITKSKARLPATAAAIPLFSAATLWFIAEKLNPSQLVLDIGIRRSLSIVARRSIPVRVGAAKFHVGFRNLKRKRSTCQRESKDQMERETLRLRKPTRLIVNCGPHT